MAPEEEPKKRVGRKLTKKRKPLRHSSIRFPERLMDEGDAQEDVTARKGKPAQHMNQSVFSMIAAAGSKVDFNARFEDESSDSEEEDETSKARPRVEGHASDSPPQEYADQHYEESVARAKLSKHHAKLLEHSILRSLPKLTSRTKKEKNYMSQSTILPLNEEKSNLQSSKSITPRDAPVMTRMLEAEAQMSSSTILPTEVKDKAEISDRIAGGGTAASGSGLVTRLKEIFGFEEPEEVISGVSPIAFLMFPTNTI